MRQKEEVHWTVGDISAMVSWFKRPGDSKMPSTKELLKQQYEQTKNRSKNNRTYLKAGEDPIISDANMPTPTMSRMVAAKNESHAS